MVHLFGRDFGVVERISNGPNEPVLNRRTRDVQRCVYLI